MRYEGDDNLDESVKTDAKNGIAYTLKSKSTIYAKASTSSTKLGTYDAGKHIRVFGKVKEPSGWYKVSYLNKSKAIKIGYTNGSIQQIKNKNDGQVTVENVGSFKIKSGKGHDVTYIAKSKYPIYSVKAYYTLAGESKPIEDSPPANSVSTLYTKVSMWKELKAENNNTKNLKPGEYKLTVTAKDIFGNKNPKNSGTSTIYVTGSVKAPTINDNATKPEQRTVKITANSSGTLYYKVGKAAWKHTTKSSMDIPVTKSGRTEIQAYTKGSTASGSSLVERRTVTLQQLSKPKVEIIQTGKTGTAVMTSNEGASISYQTESNKGTYKGPVPVKNGETVKARATKNGWISSEYTSVPVDFGEPNTPQVSLTNQDNKIATGGTATICWKADRKAASYEAVLYSAKDDSAVSRQTTTGTTASFTLAKAGDYYIEVTASNEVGTSDPSEQIDVEAVDPLTVIFLGEERQVNNTDDEDSGETEDDGKILSKVKVKYGQTLSAVEEPSKTGHTFNGWKSSKTGKISTNEYLTTPVTENMTYTAIYSKKKYKVHMYSHENELLDTQTVEYGDEVDTSIAEEKQKNKLKAGTTFTGWHVTKTSDGESKSDIKCVDSDMDLQAVVIWKEADLPVAIKTVEAAQVGETAEKVHIKVSMNTNKVVEDTLKIYLVATLKGEDSKGVEKAISADRKIVYLTKGEDSETTAEMDLIPDNQDYNYVEVVALQCNNDMSTGSTYSKTVKAPVTINVRLGEPELSETKREVSPDQYREREVEQYRYQEKEYGYSGDTKKAGYNGPIGNETISETKSRWSSTQPTVPAPVVTEANRTEVKSESLAAYKWYSYYCDCKKTYSKSKSDTCSYCKSKTSNTLVMYKTNKTESSERWSLVKTNTVDPEKGNTRAIFCNKKAVDSFTSGGDRIIVWRAGEFNKTIYRTITTKSRYKFWRWGAYSPWSSTSGYNGNKEYREERKIFYEYRLIIPETSQATGTIDYDAEKRVSYRVYGTVDSEKDLKDKNATVMVYQQRNTDPNKYQLQFLGQTVIGSGNTYEMRIIPREMPTKDTGNYVVVVSVQGETGMVRAQYVEDPDGQTNDRGLIEYDPPEYRVDVCYRDENDEIQYLKKGMKVREHGDIDMSGITAPEKEGYYFIGWNGRTTDITEDHVYETEIDGEVKAVNTQIEAIYAEKLNAVVFVDWVNQTLDIQHAKTNDPIPHPGDIEDTDGYQFIGWQKEDGTLLSDGDKVVGDMVITAAFKASSYQVRFLGADNELVDVQTVQYGESAEPPEYTAPEGKGTFVSWSTEKNWWDVTADVDVRPVIDCTETALPPNSRIKDDEDTGVRTLVLTEPEEESGAATIYYATDGNEPTMESIQEYRSGDTENGIHKYEEGLTFENDVNVVAVAYVDGKNISETVETLYEVDPQPAENEAAFIEGMELIGEQEIKASAGKDVEVRLTVDENPEMMGCGILICGDDDVFYPDVDENDTPVITAGGMMRSGRTITAANDDGWQMIWYGEEQTDENGDLLTLKLHVNEDAETGIYPIAAYYIPENTYNEDYVEVSLEAAELSVTSEASIAIETLPIKLNRTSFVYEGSPIEPVVTIDGLREGTDFTVSYEDNTDVGTAKAVIKGIGDYDGTAEKEFAITQANIANAEIENIVAQLKTGEALEPELTVTYNGKPLEKGKDYEAVYEKNVDVGTAEVTVTGIGNFKGTTGTEFEIVETVEARLAAAEAEVEKLKKEKSDAITEAEEAQTRLAQAESDLIDAQRAKEEAEAEAATNAAALEEAKQQYNAAVKAKEDAEKELKDAKDAKEATERQLAQAIKEKEAAEKALKEVTGGGGGQAQPVKPSGGNPQAVKVTVPGTSITKLKKGKKKMTVTWRKVTGVAGYQIQYSQSGSFASGNKAVNVAASKKAKLTVKKLAKKKVYYARIRTYKTVAGKTYYSGWSAAKSVKVK